MSVSVPITVRRGGPASDTDAAPDAVADNRPLVSASTTVNVSFAAEPASATVIPLIGLGFLMPTVADAGATSTGALVTDTAMFAGVAVSFRLSLATTMIT